MPLPKLKTKLNEKSQQRTLYKRNMKTTSYIFGILFFLIGFVNTFWGNDSWFWVFIVLASFLYFPLAASFIKKTRYKKVPGVLKVLLGILILWAALGVEELFDIVDLMPQDLL
jgi:energy-coupling factor transporter transmembrane protein EcfT